MGLICPSYSKVNIGLKVLSQRDDGYHNIYTIFQELNFGDSIDIEKREHGFKIIANVDWIPTNKSNICYKAYTEIKKEFSEVKGIHIKIDKKIPIGSGLGGGSANAAALLKGIKNIYKLEVTESKLEEIGGEVGADVPFFIRGKTQLGEGIGDKLTQLPKAIIGTYLLVIPKISIRTEWAYSVIKNRLNNQNKNAKFSSFINEDYSSLQIFENDFEQIVIPAYPEIGAIKSKLLNLGARFASLSGSGSTVYGVYDDEASAKEAELLFHTSHQTILANPTNS
ncbi:MAG: 4-(cytidine 5'-diphospho)-2-C-methyl-D-erythritol kinase [Candidatus Marinimicrobia bacterium]|jgi:4-diphosphocytidyl-2-C-methyl-D-erythritol kinase|nr:4-(cytidine 5'-diphospho)-2-C-methyl-D-erythritol kinase [Candidatus Neomarinimicrobiota bacterium]MBT4148737.1 4-(cytidine 5'-diphospho)-2-C-methyl-D-erythritol kinase [Candidatus Neomarinimicrobiota bacterium]